MANEGFDSSTFGSMPSGESLASVTTADIIDSGGVAKVDIRALVCRFIGGIVFGWAATTVLLMVSVMNGQSNGLARAINRSPIRDVFVSPWMIRPSFTREFPWLYELGGTTLLSPLFLLTVVVGALGLAVATVGRPARSLPGWLFAHAMLTGVLISSFGNDLGLSSNVIKAVAVPGLAFISLAITLGPASPATRNSP